MAALLAKIFRRLRRCESGAEFVEAALAFPLLMLIVMGIMDFGMMFQQYEVITNAAREGARIAVLPTYTDANVLTRVDQYIAASFLSGGGAVTRTVVHLAPVSIGSNCISPVQVNVSYTHNFLFLGGIGNYFGQSFGTKTLHASSTMREEATAGCP